MNFMMIFVLLLTLHWAVLEGASSVVQTNNLLNHNTILKSIKTNNKHDVSTGVVASEPLRARLFSKIDENGERVLNYYGLMLAGAVARSVSATVVHPLSVIKTVLQTKGGTIPELSWKVLSRGSGSQLIMSIPHGALSFAATESAKLLLAHLVQNSTLQTLIAPTVLNPALDFISSSLSTFVCSVVSTPQMVITDRIMGGVYSDFFSAVTSIFATEGVGGFYVGWLPALVQKIPSYALTWMLFQELKRVFIIYGERSGTTLENTLLGSLAAAGACCIMIPVDTVKTRMVMQHRPHQRAGGSLSTPHHHSQPLHQPQQHPHYAGMVDCLQQVLELEGPGALYKALPPRLLSVVPMIGIQFGVYELMKRLLTGKQPPKIRFRPFARMRAALSWK